MMRDTTLVSKAASGAEDNAKIAIQIIIIVIIIFVGIMT
jgi:hypothetical protein